MWASLLWLLACTHGGFTAVQGHGVLDKATHHHLILTASEGYLDIEVNLALPPEPAASQRRLLDADGDGTITATETAHYLEHKIPRLPDRILLKVDGEPVPLFELYRPEIDLLNNRRTGSYPLALRFFYSMRTPSGVHSGSVIEFEDRLWRNQDALCSTQIGSGKAVTSEGRSRLFPAGSRRTFQVIWGDLSNRSAAENTP